MPGMGGGHARLSSGRCDEASYAGAIPEWQSRPHGQSLRCGRGAPWSAPPTHGPRLDAGGGRAGVVARPTDSRGRPTAADRGVRPEQARGGAGGAAFRGPTAGDHRAAGGRLRTAGSRLPPRLPAGGAFHRHPRRAEGESVLDRPRRGPRDRVAARRRAAGGRGAHLLHRERRGAKLGGALCGDRVRRRLCADLRPSGALAGHRRCGCRRRHPERRHRLAHAGQPAQDPARAAPVVVVRSGASPGRARLESSHSPPARRARDVPLVSCGPVDAPTRARQGFRTIQGVAGVSQNDLLQDDARDAGVATLVELLDYRAARHPHDIVFRFLSGDGVEDGVLTFEALRDRAQSIAAALGEYASPGDRVVLLVPPGLEYVASFFGCLYAGVVAVPAYPPNPRRADPRVHGIIADSEARVALVHASLAARLESWLALGSAPSAVRWLDVSSLHGDGGGSPACTPAASDLAMLQYTSGSTGDPRGVMLTHANLLHNSVVIHRVSEHRAGDSGVFWLPPFHDMGLIGGIVAPVYAGRPAALMAPATFLQRPLRWLEAMARYRGTTSGAPNFAYDLCVDRTTEAERASLDLSAWRPSFNGAEPVRADTIARFEAAFAVSGLRPNVVLPCYGLAESTLFVSGGPAEQPLTTRVTSRRALEEGRIEAP